MSTKRLTTLSVDNARAHKTRREIPDAGCRGLYLIVQPSGAKSWALRYRFAGNPRKLTLDANLTLAQARVAATKAQAEVAAGRDPGKAKLEGIAAEREKTGQTIAWAVSQFIEKYAMKACRPITWHQYERVLNRVVEPTWHGRSIHSIKRRDVIDLVDGIRDEHPVMANRVLAITSKMFSWLESRDEIGISPTRGVKRPAREKGRDRKLSTAELRQLLASCGQLDQTTRAFLLLLIFTGARRNEVGSAEWSQIDADKHELVIPEDKSKSHRKHTVPLSTAAWEVIESLPRNGSKYLFPAKYGGGHFAGYAHSKRRIDALVQFEESWTWHDVRRSVASGLQELGFSVELIEVILNHTSGVFRGVTGVYARHDYADQKRAALQRWSDHLGGETDNVIPLRGQGR
jgi:integrase